MRFRLGIVVIFLSFSTVWGQRSKITSAALAVQDGDFEEALKRLKEAFANPDLLKPQDFAKGYTLQARSYMGLLMASKDPQAVLNKYPNLFEEVVTSVKKARQYDAKKEYENDLKMVAAQASNALYLKGFELFQKEKFKESRQHLTWAIELYDFAGQKEFYPVYALRGLVQMQLYDTSAAISDLELARSLAQKKTIPNDQMMPFVYATLISAYGGRDQIEKALEIAGEARNKYPTDDNIRRTELNLYIQNPSLHDRALQRFRQEIERDPQNQVYLLIYAQLWERTNLDSAAHYYKKVIEVNPDNVNARYNLGAYYVNQAAELSQKYNSSKDEKEQQALYAKMQEYFRLALPHLEKAHEKLPEDLALLQSLIQVTTHLGMEQKAQEYLRKKNAIQQSKN
ncbi:MAG: tetratricopeptide repeat protein [Bacteroidia bacterium]|nr:tetratricopeptide repeat protein [Bacteroidia bacterium]MDW8236334.1 tetratricopeptide repeat protein [Bacteroidia bacterium]